MKIFFTILIWNIIRFRCFWWNLWFWFYIIFYWFFKGRWNGLRDQFSSSFMHTLRFTCFRIIISFWVFLIRSWISLKKFLDWIFWFNRLIYISMLCRSLLFGSRIWCYLGTIIMYQLFSAQFRYFLIFQQFFQVLRYRNTKISFNWWISCSWNKICSLYHNSINK